MAALIIGYENRFSIERLAINKIAEFKVDIQPSFSYTLLCDKRLLISQSEAGIRDVGVHDYLTLAIFKFW